MRSGVAEALQSHPFHDNGLPIGSKSRNLQMWIGQAVRTLATMLRRETGMANVEKLSIALTPDMAAIVRQAVESGDYASASEVIRDALRDWKLKRAVDQELIEELRRLWQEGIDSSPAELLDMEEIKHEARSRFAQGTAQDS